MSELAAVVPGEPIDTSTFGNPVIARVISRYADSAERDFKVSLPAAGDPAYLRDGAQFQIYDGAAWRNIVDTGGDTFTGLVTFASSARINAGGQLLLSEGGQFYIQVQNTGDKNAIWLHQGVIRQAWLLNASWWRDGSNVTRLQFTDGGDLDLAAAGANVRIASGVLVPEEGISVPVGAGIAIARATSSADTAITFTDADTVIRGTTLGAGLWITTRANAKILSTTRDFFDAEGIPGAGTVTNRPNLYCNSAGRVQISTSTVATIADLEALAARVTTLEGGP